MPDEAKSREMLLQQILDGLNDLRDVPGDLAAIKQQMASIEQTVEANSRTLRGSNGDGGMLGTVRRIEERQCLDHEKLMQLDHLISGDPDDHEKTGMIGDLSELKRDADKQRKYTATAITTAIGSAIGLIFAAIKQALSLQ